MLSFEGRVFTVAEGFFFFGVVGVGEEYDLVDDVVVVRGGCSGGEVEGVDKFEGEAEVVGILLDP